MLFKRILACRITYFLLFLFFVLPFSSCKKSKTPHKEDRTVYTYSSEKIGRIDPAFASHVYVRELAGYAYEGLFQYHYLKRPYQVIPALAEALPKWSKDRRTLTIQVKKGILFQDDSAFVQTRGKGRELVAEDFVYSFKRLADPKLNSTGWWIFDGKIIGLNEWRERQKKKEKVNYDELVSGLQATNRYTLKIKLTQPSAQFIYYLAMAFTFAVPREAVEYYGEDFARNPVGTGPFVLDRKESNFSSKLIWDKNPNYRESFYPSEGAPEDQKDGFLADAGKRLPLADRIVTTVHTESSPIWLNFMSSNLDLILIPKDNFNQAVTPKKELNSELVDRGIQLVKVTSLDVTHETFNMKDPILGKNKYLRQAISLAINAGPFVEIFFNGQAIPAQGPIPPGIEEYEPDFRNPYRQFNLAKAKDLLKKAGYPNGKGLPPLKYAVNSSSVGRQMAEYIARSLSQLGIKLKVSTYTWPEFQSVVKKAKGQIWPYAWSADYPDAENFLQLFYSKNRSPGPNDSNYSNAEYDRLYEQSLRLKRGPERAKLHRKMIDIVVEDAPWVWAVHRISYVLAHPWLKNYKPHLFASGKAKYYRVEPKLKAKFRKRK